jgi:phage gpG-like protein
MIPETFLAFEAVDVLGAWSDELATGSLEQPLRDCIGLLNNGFEDNFDATKAPYGQWPAHAPYTIQKYGPHPLLILTGVMKASVTESGSASRIEEVGTRQLAIGTDLFYAPYQQFGTRKIPPRPFLWLDAPWVDQVAERFATGVLVQTVGV